MIWVLSLSLYGLNVVGNQKLGLVFFFVFEIVFHQRK